MRSSLLVINSPIIAIGVAGAWKESYHRLSENAAATASLVEKSSPTGQQLYNVQPRDTPSPTVDFDSMPACGVSNCVYPTTTEYPCPTTYPSPCPPGSGKNCSTVSLDCYCKLSTPYECAFHPCPWSDVFLLENWYNKTCDTDPGISYDSRVDGVRKFIPRCARDCLRTQTITYGCISESRNCFCSHRHLFGCTARCTRSDNSTVADWLAATCQISHEDAVKAVQRDRSGDSSQKAGGPEPPAPLRRLSWYEVLPIVVFALSTAIFVGVVIVQSYVYTTQPRGRRTVGLTQKGYAALMTTAAVVEH